MEKKSLIIIVFVSTALLFVASCENAGQTGAGLGALAGAGIGQAIGRNTESTLIGAGIGAAGGYIVGNEKDKKDEQKKTQAAIAEANEFYVNVTNANSSVFPVKIIKSGNVYIDTRGNQYLALPTEAQLKAAGYGF